jgi:RNA polymerase sigma factor (sigma-70 family)
MSDPSASLAGAAAPDGPSDAELITAVRGGSADSYGLLWQRHVDAARRLARQLAQSTAEADDLVAEAFAKVLETLRGGGGPDAAFRAYLLTALRNTFYDRIKRDKRLQLTDDMTTVDPGVPFTDTALDALESSLAARAFASLPERWQTVLWHTEIEGESPAAVAPILGLTANGVAALAYRAREGLRQAYLQMHLSDTAADPCRSTVERLGAWARKGLSKRETAQVDAHLDTCDRCRALALELLDVNHGLRGVIAPLILGAPFVAGYLATGATKAVAVGAAAGHGGLAWLHWGSSPVKTAGVAAGAVAVAAGGVFAAVAFTGGPSHTAEPPVGAITVTASSSSLPGPSGPAPGPSVSSTVAPPLSVVEPATTSPTDIGALSTAPTTSTRPVVIVPPPHSSAAEPPADNPGGNQTSNPPRTEPNTSTPPQTTSPPTTPNPPATSSSPPPVLQAHVEPAFEAVGNLLRGGVAFLKVTVGNAGPDASGPLKASLTLPPGVSLGHLPAGWSVAAPDAQPAAFTFGPLNRGAVVALAADDNPPTDASGGDDAESTTVTLTGPSVAKDSSAVFLIQLQIAADAPLGKSPSLQLTAANQDSDPAKPITTLAKVTDEGMRTEMAYHGHAQLISVGNTFLSCPSTEAHCQQARHFESDPAHLNNNDWDMAPLALAAPPVAPPTQSGSSAAPLTSSGASSAVTLPVGANVVWAGLYWAASPSSAAPTIQLCAGPDGCPAGAQTIDATQLSPAGGGYQAFADVTATVTAGGTWSATIPATSPPLPTGYGAYAGWSLMVIVADDTLPSQQIVVLDGAQSVPLPPNPMPAPIEFQASGTQAIVHTVAWDGEYSYTGDQITVDDALPTDSGGQCPMEVTSPPANNNPPPSDGASSAPSGDSSLPTPSDDSSTAADEPPPVNMECGTAAGAVSDDSGKPWNTFGVDVHTHTYTLNGGIDHTLRLSTQSDGFVLGVVGIETAS